MVAPDEPVTSAVVLVAIHEEATDATPPPSAAALV